MLEPAMLRPATEAVLQTAPRAALSAVAAARVQRNGPSRLVARIVAQNSSVTRSSSAGGIGATVAEVPALLARKSSRPSASIASPTIFSAARAFDTSPGAPITAKPSAPQPLDGRGAAGIIGQVIERDLGAAPGEQFDRRQPDARGRTRHQRGLAVKIAHAKSLVQKSFARTLPGETPARGSPPAHRRISEKRTPPFALAVGSDSTISTITASAGTEKFFTTASVMSLISARF